MSDTKRVWPTHKGKLVDVYDGAHGREVLLTQLPNHWVADDDELMWPLDELMWPLEDTNAQNRKRGYVQSVQLEDGSYALLDVKTITPITDTDKIELLQKEIEEEQNRQQTIQSSIESLLKQDQRSQQRIATLQDELLALKGETQ